MKLEGCYTALVTPFEDGEVCTSALHDLVEAQIAGGVAGVVPVGTTGESPTLSMDEHNRVIKQVVDSVDGRCKVIAGTGGNSTSEALSSPNTPVVPAPMPRCRCHPITTSRRRKVCSAIFRPSPTSACQ